MKGFWNEEKYLTGKVTRRGSGVTKGRLYHIENKGYPALLEGNETIHGEIIWVEPFQEVVKALDAMEAYSKSQIQSSQYMRVVQHVTMGDQELDAYVYRYNPQAEVNRDDQLYPISNGAWRDFMKK
jgi:gamma-glutamylcyclotransferase (GGCT)/AIG2-like uncharacterized protein YtfP